MTEGKLKHGQKLLTLIEKMEYNIERVAASDYSILASEVGEELFKELKARAVNSLSDQLQIVKNEFEAL